MAPARLRDAMQLLIRAAGQSALAVYFLVGIEWLFYATKPSFVEQLGFGARLLVLAIAPIPLIVVAWVCVAILSLLGLLLPRARALFLALVPTAFIVAGLVLMIDNFTYTVFDFGVVVVRSGFRLLFGLFFVALFAEVLRRRARSLWMQGAASRLTPAAIAMLVVSLGSACFAVALRPSAAAVESPTGDVSTRRPDVFLISGDGLEVGRIGRYGNPVSAMRGFRELGSTAVAFDNAFSNANNTSAATAMVLTGQSALATGHLHTHHFFREADAYRHLPTLLRARGYRSIQVGGTDIVDAQFWGLRRSFDVINGRRIDRSILTRISEGLGDRLVWELHFTDVVMAELSQRLRHAFLGRLMEERHRIAVRRHTRADEDALVDRVVNFVRESSDPLLVQFHSMAPRIPKSQDPKTTGRPEWFRDDVARLVSVLKEEGRFDDAIIVVWSDHGWRYRTSHRLPLIVKPPAGVSLRPTSANVQNLDIPPTVLDLLDLPPPEWMEGRSLLEAVNPLRPIHIDRASAKKKGIVPGRPGRLEAGGLSGAGVIVCNKWFLLDLTLGEMESSLIQGHTAPCRPTALPAPDAARKIIVDRLRLFGYEVADTYSDTH